MKPASGSSFAEHTDEEGSDTAARRHDSGVVAMPDMNVVGVIGLGYVGLPLLMSISERGTKALGFDVVSERVQNINDGKSYLKTIPDKEIATHCATGMFSATLEMARLKECDAILICVPTPLNVNRQPDLSYVESSCRTIAKFLRKGQLVVLESTTYPGTTEDLIKPILETSGLKCGSDFFLAYSPEREDPGNINFSTSTIPKIVGGVDAVSTQVAVLLYQRFITQVITVSSAKVAESAKLFENIFRAVNIGLVNEMKLVLDAMDINVWEVIDAAKTKPFGFMPFFPGPGWGGHCIPIDPFYLTWKAREFGHSSRFIEIAGDINARMPEYTVEKTAQALDQAAGRGLRNAKVLVIGVAYKSNVDDARESPAIPVIKKLLERKCEVSYYDPHIAKLDERGLDLMESINLDGDLLKTFDVAVICTNHAVIDWENMIENLSVVVDTRNATKSVVNNRSRIFKA